MKRWILAGAVATMACGGAAFAQNQALTEQPSSSSQLVPENENIPGNPHQGSRGLLNPGAPQNQAPAYQAPASSSLTPVTPPVAHHRMGDEMVGKFSVMAGAGADGFWGDTRNLVRPGFAWGATVLGRPNRALGLQLGYSGAVHEVRGSLGLINPSTGADIVRNGVSAVATLAPPWKVQPYVLAGYGLNWYTARGATTALGFRSDTGGAVPLGGGVRTNFGSFIADARMDYNIGIGERFAPVGGANADRYEGLIQVGANF